jgi:perosamine synthetase
MAESRYRRSLSGERRIPVAEPALVGHEAEYVADCLTTTWISSAGRYVAEFERMFAEFCGVEHALSCANGTVALHLALLAEGVGPGDEVIVPSLTYVATANCVRYCGATPVFVDSEPDTWNLDPVKLDAVVTERTKGIVAVHLYGHPADMDAILQLADRRGLFVIEDAAEAHGARYRGRIVGSIASSAIFSFYGNKIVTTGEGGMVVTNDSDRAERIRILKGQGQDPNRRYWFPVVGYNYRLTNVAAAIGVAQMERIDWHVERRRENAAWYREAIGDIDWLTLSPELPWARNAYWMSCALVSPDAPVDRDQLMGLLAERGIETRPFFYPLHTLPPYEESVGGRSFPIAENLAARGLNLPSSALLSREDVAYVAREISRVAVGAAARAD